MRSVDHFRLSYIDELQKLAFDPGTVTAASTAALALMTGYGKAYKLSKKLKSRLAGKISEIKLKLKKAQKFQQKSGQPTGFTPTVSTVAKELGKGLVAAPKAVSEDIASVT